MATASDAIRARGLGLEYQGVTELMGLHNIALERAKADTEAVRAENARLHRVVSRLYMTLAFVAGFAVYLAVRGK